MKTFKLEELQTIKRQSGIYALKKEGVIVYIGQSKNVYCRILEHIMEAKKDFDDIIAIYCEDMTDVEVTEVSIIAILKPKYNMLHTDIELYHRLLPTKVKEDLKIEDINKLKVKVNGIIKHFIEKVSV